jgi:hypothetical protein
MNYSQHACWLDHMPTAAGADSAAFQMALSAGLLQSPAAPACPVYALTPAAGAPQGRRRGERVGGECGRSSGLRLSLPTSAAALGVSVMAAGAAAGGRQACMPCLLGGCAFQRPPPSCLLMRHRAFAAAVPVCLVDI